MDTRTHSNKRSSRQHTAEPSVSPPVVKQEYVDEQSIKLIDILPLVLCLGIIVLLYFIVRELQSEQENQETRYNSLLKRITNMEKKSDVKVPEPSSPDNGKKEGTYVLKNSVVSFKPDDDDDDGDTIEVPDSTRAVPDISTGTVSSSEDEDDGDFN